VLFGREAKDIAIGAELFEQRLLVGEDSGLLCLSGELDDVALLGVTLFVDERMKKAGVNTEIWNGSNVFVGDVRRVDRTVPRQCARRYTSHRSFPAGRGNTPSWDQADELLPGRAIPEAPR